MSNMPPPPPGYSPQSEGSQSPSNGVGVASLVLGVLAIVTGLFLIGGLLGLVGVILGFVGRGKAKRGEANNGGVALAGIITSIIGMLISIAVIVVAVAFVSNTDFDSLNDCLVEASTDAEEEQCAEDFADDLFGN